MNIGKYCGENRYDSWEIQNIFIDPLELDSYYSHIRGPLWDQLTQEIAWKVNRELI